MVNFHVPLTIAREFGAYAFAPGRPRSFPSPSSTAATVAAVNLWHTMDGVFIWEFFTTLKYEWDVIRGHRPYRWTIWVYSLTRVSTLLAIVLNLVTFNDNSKMNCQALIAANNFFAYVAFGAASLLIVFRIIAIWNRDTVIILTAMGLWLANVGFLIYGIVEIRSVWSDQSNSCVLLNPQSNKINILVSLISDTTLLLIMLVGLLRLRFQSSGYRLGRILWNQSLVWLALATVAEVPPTVFMFLNLNEAMDIMFQAPNMVIMPIAATRMYRSLINLGTYEVSDGVLGADTVSEMRNTFRPIRLKQLVFSETVGEQYTASQSESGDTDIHARVNRAHEVSLNRGVDGVSSLEK